MRKNLVLALFVAAAVAGLLWAGVARAAVEPPADSSLVSCQQYRFDDGDCWTICHFFGANGENQGYVISYFCN